MVNKRPVLAVVLTDLTPLLTYPLRRIHSAMVSGDYGVKFVNKGFADPNDPHRRKVYLKCEAFYLDKMESRQVLQIDDGELTTCRGFKKGIPHDIY